VENEANSPGPEPSKKHHFEVHYESADGAPGKKLVLAESQQEAIQGCISEGLKIHSVFELNF